MKNPPLKSQTLGVSTDVSRRRVLGGIGAVALLHYIPAHASTQLPLKTTGLEHMGTVVPDVEAAGKFYGRLFNPELHKEKEPPLRYYVTLGVGYLALGSRANQSRAFFDHFCALVQDYDGRAMTEELGTAGLPAGKFGIIPDPDGIGLQLLGVPGGLAKSTEPAGRIVAGDALVRPLGLAAVVLHVPDVDKSVQFYRKFFGKEASGTRKAAWFQIADTRLGLEKAAAGEEPRVHRIAIKVEKFDRKTVSAELTKMGATLEQGAKQGLRFRDPLGLGIELQPA